MLQGGDRRSIGKADMVAALVEKNAARFEELWDCLTHDDGLVRMRAADALEKLSRVNAGLFATKKTLLLSGALDDGTAEVRWHLVTMTSRLALSAREAEAWTHRLTELVRHDPSRIVKAMALEAAADIATRHPALAREARALIDWALVSPWPSLRARARKLAKTTRARETRAATASSTKNSAMEK